MATGICAKCGEHCDLAEDSEFCFDCLEEWYSDKQQEVQEWWNEAARTDEWSSAPDSEWEN